MPGNDGRLGLPDTPVASTSCLGRSTIGWPSRSMFTVHSPVASLKAALFASALPQ